MKNWNVRKAIVAREDMPEHHRLAQSLVLAAPDRARRRGDRRHRHPHPDRGRRRQGRAGGDPVLRHRRRDLRLRGARLCRDGDDDPGVRVGLHLHLCRVRRAARLVRRLVADPRIYPGGQRGRGRLVGLCGRLPAIDRAWACPRRWTQGPSSAGHQPPGDLHHRGRRRPADRRHARERQPQRRPGGRSSCSRWPCSSPSPAGLRRATISSRSCPTASPSSGRPAARSA